MPATLMKCAFLLLEPIIKSSLTGCARLPLKEVIALRRLIDGTLFEADVVAVVNIVCRRADNKVAVNSGRNKNTLAHF